MKQRILLVDDDETLTGLLSYTLDSGGYEVQIANNGAEAISMASRTNPDLVIMDVMMPEVDGFEACTRIRQSGDIPILMLSAKSTDGDVIRGLSLGADDYVKKPFSVAELLARVSALLRRHDAGTDSAVETRQMTEGGLVVDIAKHVVHRDGEPVHITPTEFKLLLVLMRARGEAVPSEKILVTVWGPEYRTEKQYLKLYVHTLKKKLERNPREPQYVHTVRGVGYRLAYEPAQS